MPENKTLKPEPNHNRVLLTWKTPEFVPHTRSKTWFLVAGVIVLSLTAYAILTGSATMAIVFIMLGGIYYLTHNQKPKIIDIGVTELGLYVGSQFFPYNSINAFWIVYHPPYVRRLYFRTGTKSFTQYKVELNHQNPVELRHLLGREIPEIEGGEEGWTDALIRLLRLQ
jgi:hypothetical protein